METITRLLSALIMIACALPVTGCGGGGDEDDEEDDDADASGYWTGTMTPDGGAASSATLYVGTDGRFVIVSSRIFFSGTGSTNGLALSATATGYAGAGIVFPSGSTVGTFTLLGTVNEMSNISGSYSGSGESGRLAFTYNATNSTRTASLTAASGSYVVSTAPGAATASLVVSSTGALTLNVSSGCMGTGQLTVIDATRNYYNWSLSLTACSNTVASGVGFMTAANALSLLGTGNVGPFLIAATK